MSYCRWSSMNSMCDLYCYEDVSGGWTTHVAALRMITEPPPTPPIPKSDAPKEVLDEWVKAYRVNTEAAGKIERKPIGLPYDGESFNDPTLEDFYERVKMLRDAGYNVPDYVFDEIAEEMAEETRDGLAKGKSDGS